MRSSSFLFSFLFFIFISIISFTSATATSSSLSLPRYISETSIQSDVRPLSLSLNKEGFHRDLELSYLFDLPALRRALPLNNDLECRVALLLELPITSFLDQFQIQDLRRKEQTSSTDQLLKQLLSKNTIGEEDVQETITPDVLLLDLVDLEKPSFLIPNETLVIVQHNFRFSSTLLSNPSVALKR
jgi:hypothetical protein